MSTQVRIIKPWKLSKGSENKQMVDINLTESTMRNVLSYLTYEEMLPLRLVSRSFNHLVSKILNKNFEILGDMIDNALNETSKLLKKGSVEHNTIKHFKVLYYLRAEYNVIKTVMKKYLDSYLVNFSGGSILDCFYKILTSRGKGEGSSEYMKVFNLVGIYLSNFSMEVDGMIKLKDKNKLKGCFGLNIVDILDCGLEFGRNIQFSQGPDCVYLEGEYHGKDVNQFEDLPDMNKQNMTESEVKSFVQLIRNNIRWSNLLFCIQRETSELAHDYFTPVQKIISSNSLTLRKDPAKVLNQRDRDLSYILTLKCSKDDLPPKTAKMLRDNLSNDVPDWSGKRKSIINSPSEFNMLIKMKTKTEEGVVNEKVIKLYHVGDECVSSEFNKLVSALR